jgi:hypothetical protein
MVRHHKQPMAHHLKPGYLKTRGGFAPYRTDYLSQFDTD